MTSKRKESHPDKLKSRQGEKDVQKLKEKNLEEIAKRIEEAEVASGSSEDSPFVSEFEDSDDESLIEDDGSVDESGSEESEQSGDKDATQFSDDDRQVGSSDNEDSFKDKDHSVIKGGEHDNHDVEEDLGRSDDPRDIAEESDSSEDEVAPRNTVGNVPLAWYGDEEHIGYDLSGKKIKKKEKKSKLDSFLAKTDDSKSWRKIVDEYNDEEVELTKEEINLIRRMVEGKAPHADFDPYPSYVDWFKWDGAKHPLSNAPEPKRRFIPSKWEAKKIVKYVRAIRSGLIKPNDKPKGEPKYYALWDEPSAADRQGLAYIPAPKPKLPGHEESYNPSAEYIPTQEEINSYQLMFEEDRPKFIPKQ